MPAIDVLSKKSHLAIKSPATFELQSKIASSQVDPFKGNDHLEAGAYFITTCCQHRKNRLGAVGKSLAGISEIHLNELAS